MDDVRLADETKGSSAWWYASDKAMTLDEALAGNEADIVKMIESNISGQDSVWAAACG